MNVRMIIQRGGWAHELHVTQTFCPGLAVILYSKGGKKSLGVACVVSAMSYDAVILDAQSLYSQLLAMHESNAAAAAQNAHHHETTTNHSSEPNR